MYRRIQLPDEEVARLRLAVRGELAGQAANAHEHAERANRQMAQLSDERTKLMRAHYEGAVPIDLLKSEMDRLTRAMAAAEKEATFARAEVADVEAVLEQALTVAGSCALHYEAAPERIRRQMNQGFFTKLWILQDGSVGLAEMTEPFEALLSPGGEAAKANRHHPVTDGDGLDGRMEDQGFAKGTMVDLTRQHTNHEVLVEGPEITIRPVGTRRLAGDAR